MERALVQFVLLVLFGGLLVSCISTQKPEKKNIIIKHMCEMEEARADLQSDSIEEKYCVHKVVSMVPTSPGNNCNPKDIGYRVGDKLCILCKDGEFCQMTSQFVDDDGTWLSACEITTKKIDGTCKSDWPKGTCK